MKNQTKQNTSLNKQWSILVLKFGLLAKYLVSDDSEIFSEVGSNKNLCLFSKSNIPYYKGNCDVISASRHVTFFKFKPRSSSIFAFFLIKMLISTTYRATEQIESKKIFEKWWYLIELCSHLATFHEV